MSSALRKQARTTPAVRAEIAASRESVAVLARRCCVTEATIRKWRARTSPQRLARAPSEHGGVTDPVAWAVGQLKFQHGTKIDARFRKVLVPTQVLP